MAPNLLKARPSMSANQVVLLKAVREMKKAAAQDLDYQAKILGMEKWELLEEMMRFQEERTRLGHLTPEMMSQGQILFKALEDSAETQELRLLSRSYRKHLRLEFEAFIKNQNPSREGNSSG
jgi:hypothetical protein